MTLHGQLSPREQAKVLSQGASSASGDALKPGEGRIIVATSVAESALTVPGVRQPRQLNAQDAPHAWDPDL